MFHEKRRFPLRVSLVNGTKSLLGEFLNESIIFSAMKFHMDWSRDAFSTLSIFRSSHQMCSIKKVSLKIPQNSQENTCARVSLLIKLHG